jgi:hypothetical protein
VAALDAGFVPAGEDAQHVLYESDLLEECDLVDALREVSKRYDAADFDLQMLRTHIVHDIDLLEKILKLVSPITPDKPKNGNDLTTKYTKTLFELLICNLTHEVNVVFSSLSNKWLYIRHLNSCLS